MSDDRQNVVDMAGMRVDDDHLLSMYVDNELDAERTIALISRLRSEPALRARLEVMEANDQRVRALFAESDNHIPKHLAPMVAAENVAVLGMTRRWQRWASVAVAASFATAMALVVDLNQTDVFNPMSMDPQLANVLEHSPSRATGWDALDNERQFRSVLTFPCGRRSLVP
jgi:anti-sigma factor RsiW